MKSTVTTMWKQLFLHLIIGFSIIATYAQLQVHTPEIEAFQELVSSNSLQTKYTADRPDIQEGSASIDPVYAKTDLSIISVGNTSDAFDKEKDSGYTSALASTDKAILLIGSTANKFSQYSSEILIAEGLNGFTTTDITAVTAEMLNSYDVVIVGNIPLTSAQVTLLSNWTTSGGTLITFRPDVKLAPLLGLTPASGTLANRYLLVHTATGPGKGIVSQTMQYQGEADLYTVNSANKLATLYSSATSATVYPAVTINSVGNQGGAAVAFTYDLAKSVIYTRQGNPQWAGQKRDGQAGPIRSDDQFYPDWIDFSKVMIPQADEQQRLLANIITLNARKPVPRFWYFPRGLKAVVVMTGDDHGNGGTKARFNQYLRLSSDNSAEAVADWRAIRGTSYIYPNTPISDAEAKAFEQQGFEVALHLTTNCANFTPTSLERDLTNQLAEFKSRYPSVAPPTTNRTHCIAWSDWHTQPKLEAPKGIRLDANYYYWPSPWVQDRPGLFTGSGIPMRFADLDGGLIDCYQLTTQMTDESDQTFPFTIDQLLNKALGSEGYYGAFCANMHTDANTSDGSDAIIASAKSRDVPVISSKQLLTWLDGRNGSSFSAMSWNGGELRFTVSVANGARSLQGMLPMTETTGPLVKLTLNGATVPIVKTEFIKGVEYAFFPASPGEYIATYDADAPQNQAPTVNITAPANNATFTAPASITITANALDSDGDVTRVEFFSGEQKIGEDTQGNDGWSYTWNGVQANTYTLTAKAYDNNGASTTSAQVTIEVEAVCPCSVFTQAFTPSGSLQNDGQAIQVGMKFRSSVNGSVTGVRFYKQTGNTGTHTGQLYSSGGTLLASVVFQNETASGWQQAAFSSPVAVTAGTTYLISYHSSGGGYSADDNGFSQAVVNGPLTGLQNGVDGANGVYRYTSSPAFPTSNFQSSNYFVDVVFETGTQPSNQAPTVAITAPANNASFTAPASIAITASASDTDGTVSKVEFYQGTTKIGEDTNGNDDWGFVWADVPAGNYTLTAKATDDRGTVGTSVAVNIMVTPGSVTCPCTVFKTTDAPANDLYNDGQAIQVGMKFRSSTNGFVTGVRFYKQSGNTGTHTGQLYSSAGALLASVVFQNETASGWQQAAFSTPVAITAGTTYLISYHSSGGGYSANNPYFTQAVENHPLRALASGEDGPNGVYKYSANPAFPDEFFLSANYWVDVIFNTDGAPSNQSPTVSLTAPSNNATFTAPATINLSASASDADGSVAKVEFLQGETKLGEDTNESDGWSFAWADVPAGTYTLTARATDNAGAVVTSAAISITVNEPANKAPLTAITSPETGATFTAPASIIITATATDEDGTVDKVEFFNGDLKLGEDVNGSDGWAYAWSNVPAGSYQLTTRALDNGGAVGTSSAVSITVSEPTNQAPAVAITTPANDATFTAPASIDIAVSASDTDGSVTKVEFFQGTVSIGEDTDGSNGWSFTWGNVQAGNYAFTVKATDDKGAVTTSPAVNITVTEPTNQAPVVAITSPMEGANFIAPATIKIVADASDAEGTVSRVEFYQGEAKLGEDTDSSDGWEYTWSNVTVGAYQLMAKAFDNLGAESSSSIVSISVNEPDNIAPIVVLTSPDTGATFTAPATITITADASDIDGSITKVEFYQGETKLGERLTSPYTYTWSDVGTGSYNLTAKATDNKGAVAVSNMVNITVNVPNNQPPAVALTAPANNATFTAPATINLSASASDADGSVAKVEFLQGETKLGEDTNESDGWAYAWTNVPAGSYELTARAIDNAGAAVTSAAVKIIVNEPANQAPVVSITAPANNSTFTAPATVNIVASASDADGTVSKVEFYQGATKLGEDTNGSDGWGYVWSGVPTGTYQLAARATDNAGAVTASAEVSITVNPAANQAPTVAITAPANNTSFAAPASVTITATASDPDGTVAKVEFYNGTAKLGEDDTSPYTFAWASVPAGSYQLTAKAFDNIGAATISAVVNITVSAPANTPPTVQLTAPADNSTFTAPATITLTASASDADGSIARVEFYQGTTKLGEDLTSPYSFAWANIPAGTYQLTARAFDNGGLSTSSSPVNVTVSAAPSGCPCTVFSASSAPVGPLRSDGRALQLGMKFRSSVAGYVTGVRFYKQTGNTGTHTGQLYSSGGTLLASVVFQNETASGWQQASFSSPVAITAGTTYVITYHSSAGYYSADDRGLSQAIVNGPLRGLANGESGRNGVYKYTRLPAYPTSNYQASNYWVDVVFNTTLAATSSQALTAVMTGVEKDALPTLLAFPNPSTGEVTVSFALEEDSNYNLGLYDATGKRIETLKQGYAPAGEQHKVELNGAKLPIGLYLIRLQTDSAVQTVRLILER
ncbi:Por secretion system C-terminal sorting domain-containing protein [Pontibacter chinhatensis]|uniref:Por secretion system C-terminal sorting domain-containing protein n=2 Tax=Pontibacter chinhatensis TaxID=1436961 RepID=A0A1I2WZJ0_9BACT|nr:Por secretion system C-terminal sorting domain-containing protein [Pontibacter chinhatensis]